MKDKQALLKLFTEAKNRPGTIVHLCGWDDDKECNIEEVIFNRGYRLSRNLITGNVGVYCVRNNDVYTPLSRLELQLFLEKGFHLASAILQLDKCRKDIDRVLAHKKTALEQNNRSQVRYFDKRRKFFLTKEERIKRYINDLNDERERWNLT